MFVTFGCTMLTMARSRMIGGNASITLVTKSMAVSTRPRKYPLAIPSGTPTAMPTATAPKPTTSDTRAP